MPSLRLVAGSALLALVVTGCGSQNPSADPSKKASSTKSSPAPTASASTKTQSTVQGLRDRVQKNGTGTFSMVTRTSAGQLLASIRGRYALDDQQVAAQLKVPQKGAKPATARVELVRNDAFFQVAQWKKPSRTCWLRTTTVELSQGYGLDVSTTDQVPLPVALLDNFRAERTSGKGVVDGTLDIAAVLPLLSGSIKRQLIAARPQGAVPGVLTFHGNDVLLTVPGYALSATLSRSLGIEESKLASIATSSIEAGLRITGPVARVRAPSSSTQMTAAELKANRCG